MKTSIFLGVFFCAKTNKMSDISRLQQLQIKALQELAAGLEKQIETAEETVRKTREQIAKLKAHVTLLGEIMPTEEHGRG
jgi:peptidoglycan hydrolase CwlO-like protein